MPTVSGSGAAVLLTAVLMLTASCTGAGATSDEPAEPAIGQIPVVVNSASLRLPVELYLPTAAQSDRASRAQLILIQQCLARFGIAYVVEPVAASAYGPTSLTDRRYGISDAALAASHGYGLGPRDPALAPQPERPDIGADGQNVLTGSGKTEVKGQAVPQGGCLAEADRSLHQGSAGAEGTRLGQRLQLESFEQSKADSRVRAVFATWSACMTQAGLHYADPLGAASDPEFAQAPSPKQVQVAMTDIHCKLKTNLIGVWYAVEAAYQQRSIAANAAGFASAKAAIEALDRSATAIVAAGHQAAGNEAAQQPGGSVS